jgi:hypothetical protein
LNRYFNICLTLNEIFEELINLISQGKNTFIIENDKIIFIIPTTIKTIKEIKFELIKEKKDEKSEIENIIEIINHQNKRLKYLEEENKKQSKIILELKLKLSPFTEDDFNLIKSYINDDINKVQLELIFDSQRDGFNNKTFFKLCKNKFPTLTLFKTIEGEKFGGYSSISFREEGIFHDPDSFLFSIIIKENINQYNL